jgi:hypothetical protein
MTTRLFLACKFRTNDAQTYTYHYDGGDVAVGDKVKAPSTRNASGWSAVTVVAIHNEEPGFATKPILGKVEASPPMQPDFLGADK